VAPFVAEALEAYAGGGCRAHSPHHTPCPLHAQPYTLHTAHNTQHTTHNTQHTTDSTPFVAEALEAYAGGECRARRRVRVLTPPSRIQIEKSTRFTFEMEVDKSTKLTTPRTVTEFAQVMDPARVSVGHAVAVVFWHHPARQPFRLFPLRSEAALAVCSSYTSILDDIGLWVGGLMI